ncbi:DUF2971 domain-containing protein [Vibrio alginolyticus]|uniref:DUF2971 domain-containing protein n=1 Tax=unclassified Vibrio TaxID=2614977 RepID=UPI0014831CE9|nr:MULTISPECIES: DUF2971 domain-containing protein [unclassified Vibrio]EGR2325223.1 DUF2971 domain-containing protein [Vibrio alginolyticus]ELS4797691.1 DUF2971 domain-containing protein [Vibrio alginolyticus]NNN39545.1 DUF2971 domain-containing protein [Vibrio sp. 2-2(2)]NNO02088.1 DUF2971 domain-containing protein [Vibrio sp. 7-5(1-a)]
MSSFDFPPLFKFRTVNENTLNSIANNEIWFANIDSLNDPFELFYKIIFDLDENNIDSFFKLMIDVGSDREKYNKLNVDGLDDQIRFMRQNQDIIANLPIDVKKIIVDGINENIKSLNKEMLEKIRRNTKLFCLSTVDSHPLLWGHYANGMRGICIEYDFNKQKRTPYFGSCYVEYKEQPLILKVADFIQRNHHINDFSKEIFGTKNTSWCYEKEFRLIATGDYWAGNKYKLSEGVIKSIVIGEFIDHQDLDKVLKVVDGTDIELKIAISEPEFFRTKTIPYSPSFFEGMFCQS